MKVLHRRSLLIIPLSGIFPHKFCTILAFDFTVDKALFMNPMILERPFDLNELFKPMSVWSASLIFEMRTFAKETPQP